MIRVAFLFREYKSTNLRVYTYFFTPFLELMVSERPDKDLRTSYIVIIVNSKLFYRSASNVSICAYAEPIWLERCTYPGGTEVDGADAVLVKGCKEYARLDCFVIGQAYGSMEILLFRG